MTDGSAQAPGWYYAQGDPPGTQRYWDGTQWQGGPQAVPGAEGGSSGGRAPAELGPRFVAFLIDYGILVVGYIVLLILGAIFGAIADVLGAIVVFLGALGILAFGIYNYLYLQGTTGQTIGKKRQGITLLRATDGQPVGIGMAFVRGLLGGILANICLLDYIWIFIDEENRRLSDKILDFNVYQA